ncbi:beta family protein [Streptomyces albogriseolus]|uniref:beta family protein n=1 Tax=Streptomyces albogriseolus TaxID=1887 RepID=UPI00380BA5A0
MSGPLYVPVLPTKQHAAEVFPRLRPDVRSAVRPLWNLPPLHKVAQETLGTVVDTCVGRASAVSRHGGWIDAPFGTEALTPAFAEALAARCRFGQLKPVTGPERTAEQQAMAVGTARHCSCGLGVRVQVTGEWDARLWEGVRGLLAQTGPEMPLDLLLDMGAVLDDRTDAGKEALRALDTLMPMTAWRSAVLIGGGLPPVSNDLLEDGPVEVPRGEWRMWHEVRATDRTYASRIGYGDYGVQHPAALAQPLAPRKGGPSWGTLRYTTDRSYYIVRTLTKGPDRIDVTRAAARRITELPEFRGARAGHGEAWLSDCAHGPRTTGRGAGGFREWLRAGYVQHMTYVVRCLPDG